MRIYLKPFFRPAAEGVFKLQEQHPLCPPLPNIHPSPHTSILSFMAPLTFIFLPSSQSPYIIPSHPIGSILKEKPLEKMQKEKKKGKKKEKRVCETDGEVQEREFYTNLLVGPRLELNVWLKCAVNRVREMVTCLTSLLLQRSRL